MDGANDRPSCESSGRQPFVTVRDAQWFLDTETGDAVRVSEYDDDDELRDQIEEGFGDWFIRIPYQGSSAGYRDMVE